MIVYAVLLIKTAWISDDAAITLRTVLNFINGFGPNFNFDERVQAYTHPLWFLLVSLFSFITGNVFITVFMLQITMSVITLGLLVRFLSPSMFLSVMAVSIFIFSKAYLDFSTSGLENSLSHLLIVLALVFSKRRIFFLFYGLLYLSRPDLPLILAPLALFLWFKSSQRWTSLGLVILPGLIWTLFSLIYYGFPFPTPAYAKLASGTPQLEITIQGIAYLFNSLSVDAITIPVIFMGILFGLGGNKKEFAMALGVLIYSAYIVWIGGDFMSGRFFTAPLLISVIILISHHGSQKKYFKFGLALSIAMLCVLNAPSTLLTNYNFKDRNFSPWGIADERGFYFQNSGFMVTPIAFYSNKDYLKNTTHAIEPKSAAIGYEGISGGPFLHIIDLCGLTDPLLARFPAAYDRKWRIGHFKRRLPDDYINSIKGDKNNFNDIAMQKYYDAIRSVTRGDIFKRERFENIAKLNLGLIEKPAAYAHH